MSNNSTMKASRAAKLERERQEIEALLNPVGEEEQEKLTTETEPEVDPEVIADGEAEPAVGSEEATWKKRYADLRRSSSKTKSDLEARLKALEEAGPQTMTMPATDEEIEEWQTKFPDIARIVETLASKKAQERFGEADTEIKALKADKEETALERMEAKIRAKVPEYDKLVTDDKFLDWLDEQPVFIQNALYENTTDADQAIFVFESYKAKTQAPITAAQAAKDAASSVKARGKPDLDDDNSSGSILESWVDGLTPKEFAKEEKRIMKAIQSGKFVYDMSGGAR